ncbi:hypothetical protein NT04LM_2288 [Listeria monocytogenes FSL F2-208]|nr:hypothetical protein NT04LM_2288 [Listeria monocytogenes FSL F2-208]
MQTGWYRDFTEIVPVSNHIGFFCCKNQKEEIKNETIIKR